MALKYKIQMGIGLVLLIIGGLIYIAYRKETLMMFQWFRDVGFDYSTIRNNINYPVFDFVKYSLPDGLWLLAYQLIVAALWKNEISVTSLICIYSMPLIILGEEVLQGLGIVHGTFDYLDLLSYLIAIAVATITIIRVK